MEERRVVVTGMGAITPIGNNVSDMWNGIKESKCGIDEITLFDTTNFKTKLDAEVKEYNPLDYFDVKQSKRLDRSSQFAIIASREAMNDSKISKENSDFTRIGIFISSGIAGLSTIEKECKVNFEKGNKRVSPLFIPMSIANMPAGNVAIDLGLKGESMSILTACSSSTHAIGEAFKTIKLGQEDIIFAGGCEAAICEIGIAGFENMKALSFGGDRLRASIPFDKERNGFVMGEGAGVLVLEDLNHALKRNAKIYGEIIGFGSTTDAYHITSPEPEGNGASNAMKRAIDSANINISDIEYINAHGTSTHLNDSIETIAIKNVFGNLTDKLLVSSTKGNTGHLLGAAGGVETIITLKALQEGIVPPTINYKVKDEECDLNIVTNKILKKNIKIAMSNSLGFGGHNASIIMKKWSE